MLASGFRGREAWEGPRVPANRSSKQEAPAEGVGLLCVKGGKPVTLELARRGDADAQGSSYTACAVHCEKRAPLREPLGLGKGNHVPCISS